MKYTFTGESKIVFGITLQRIKKTTEESGGCIEVDNNVSLSPHPGGNGEPHVAEMFLVPQFFFIVPPPSFF